MTNSTAINVNSLNGNPFPVAIEYSQKEGVYCLYLTPISVGEIFDFLPGDIFLVFNVDSNEFDGTGSISLIDVCKNHSSFVKAFDNETLLMRKEQIISLLNHVGHYNFHLISAKEDMDLDSVIQVIDISDKWNDATVIDKTNSEIFISSHDDCYLYLETKDKELAEQLISLQIKTLVKTVSTKPMSDLTIKAQEFITINPLSIVIPRTLEEDNEHISWQILEGSFKNFVYGEEMSPIGTLVYFRQTGAIRAELTQYNDVTGLMG